MSNKPFIPAKPGPERYSYELHDRCIRCGQEFGDHSSKAPHGSLRFAPPCGGFAMKEGSTEPKVKGLLNQVVLPRDPWSALL